jgi:hypothetical protein
LCCFHWECRRKVRICRQCADKASDIHRHYADAHKPDKPSTHLDAGDSEVWDLHARHTQPQVADEDNMQGKHLGAST